MSEKVRYVRLVLNAKEHRLLRMAAAMRDMPMAALARDIVEQSLRTADLLDADCTHVNTIVHYAAEQSSPVATPGSAGDPHVADGGQTK